MKFLPGSIRRIKLVNFLTYTEGECFPCGGLNVIVSPNGTGKSSIVCGICVGLGGSPTILDRSNNMADFIRHGADQAITEIELTGRPDKENDVIVRKIKRNGSSEWRINGQVSREKDVKELVKAYQIQVNNLCQFLSQHRVSKFAEMSHKELLLRTQEVIDDELYKKHLELAEKFKNRNDQKTILDAEKKQLELKRKRATQLQPQVEAQQKYNDAQAYLSLLKQKQKWSEYDENRTAYKQLKQQSKELKSKLDALTAEWEPVRRKKEDNEKTLKRMQTDFHAFRRRVSDESEKSRADFATGLMAVKKEKQDAEQKFGLLQDKESERKLNIARIRSDITDLESDIANCPEEDCQPEMTAVQSQLDELAENTLEKENHKARFQDEQQPIQAEQIRIRHELSTVQNMEKRRLEHLRRKDDHAFRAYEWLDRNRHLFKAPIHGPVIMTLNFEKSRNARFVENTVSKSDLFAFICDSEDDATALLEQIRDKQNLAVPVLTVPRNAQCQRNPVPQDLQALGFDSFVSDVFDAPESVKTYLISMFKLNQIPIGSTATENQLEEATQACLNHNMGLFLTPSQRVAARVSKYSNNLSTTITSLESRDYFPSSGAGSEEKKRENQLNQTLAKLVDKEQNLKNAVISADQDLLNIRKQRELLLEKKSRLKGRLLRRQELTARLQRRREDLRKIENQFLDMDKEKGVLKRVKKQALLKFTSLLETFERIAAKTHMHRRKLAIQACQILAVTKEVDGAEQVAVRIARQREQLEQERSAKESECHKLKTELQKMLEEAGKGPDGRSLIEGSQAQLQAKFSTLPAVGEALDAAVLEKAGEVRILKDSIDPDLMDEYKAVMKAIEQSEANIAQQERQVTNFDQEFESQKQKWLKPLDGYIRQISDKFSQFLQLLDCAGEIQLKPADSDVNDVGNYEILPMVAFRESEKSSLQVLNSKHHSGGEKALSTILYMLALQQFSQVPFRCVDEINQGMDAVNERRVFEFMVDLLAGSGRKNLTASQYFMVTPKLLLDLEYLPDMLILVVHNGSLNIKDSNSYHLDKLLNAERAAASVGGAAAVKLEMD